MNKFFLSSVAILTLQSAYAEQHWVPLNPGAGGQVQDVVADPNQKNVVYMASDMEGVYKSTDNGENWNITGHLVNNRVFSVDVKPGNSNVVFAGTLYGLHRSTDGTNHYTLAPETENVSIASVAFKPNNPNHIIAAPGWRDDDDFIHKFGETANGQGYVFVSTNGGNSWTKKTFDWNAGTDRNVYSLEFDPSNANIAYLGSNKGVYKSTDSGMNWSKINGPDNSRPWNRGVTVSPNGKVLYGTFSPAGSNFGTNNNWIVYATPTSSINWQQVTNGLDSTKRYWYPEVDPRSTGNTQKVLLGAVKDRMGLYEGTFNWNSSNQLTSYSWDRIFAAYSNGNYDLGWDYATPPNARFAHYTPNSAGWARGVWSTTNQTMFYADHNASNNTYSWKNKYSNPVYSNMVWWFGQSWPTYAGKGTESTYTYDVAKHDNYMVQGQADNGLVESWDGGYSWSNMQHRRPGYNLSDVQAVDIADAWGVPTVVAQATGGYGGAAHNGSLWAKKLVNHDPTDQWVQLAGGGNGKAGLPHGVLRDIAVSPANPAKVFMFSTGYGMYVLDDVGRALDYQAQGKTLSVEKIYDAAGGAASARRIAPHPTNEDVVFFSSTSGQQGVWRGEKQSNGSWDFQRVLPSAGWDAEVHVWENNGQVYLMSFAKDGGPGIGDGNNWQIVVSTDEGQTWKKEFAPAQAKAIRPTSNLVWWDAMGSNFKFTGKGGSAAYGNKIMLSYYDHDYQVGYGVFMGTIQGDGSITWVDVTGDLHFSGMTSSRFIKDGGQVNLYSTTPGAGLWKTGVSGVNGPSDPTSAPSAANSVSTSNTTITWNDNSNNEQGFRIERSDDGAAYAVVGQVGRDAERYVDGDTPSNTQFEYRVVAFNEEGETASTSGGSNPPPPPSGTFGAPTWVSVTVASSTSVNISWSSVAEAATFDVQKQISTETTWRMAAYGVTGTSVNVNGLDDSATYKFRVKARKASGSASGWTETGSTTLGGTPEPEPEPTTLVAPTGVVPSVTSDTTITLNWNASTGADSYTIERRLSGSSWVQVASSVTGTSYSDSGLQASSTYAYRAKAVAGSSSSDWRQSANVTTEDAQAPEPSSTPWGAPTGVSAGMASSTSANVSWIEVTEAATYDVQKQKAGDSWRMAEYGVTGTEVTIEGLEAGKSYIFRAKARKASGSASGWTVSNGVDL